MSDDPVPPAPAVPPGARDERVLRLLDSHPVTAAMLVEVGWFPSRARARRRLARLAARGDLLAVGAVCLKPGRPETVYCRFRPKADQLLHEVGLTRFCLRLHAGRVVRGPEVQASPPRPDAVATIGGRRFYLEWDRGTMGYEQVVRDRFATYERQSDLVLWVCATEARREGLRARAGAVRHAALFATAADALADPHGPVWLDHAGNRAALPRERATGTIAFPPPAGTPRQEAVPSAPRSP